MISVSCLRVSYSFGEILLYSIECDILNCVFILSYNRCYCSLCFYSIWILRAVAFTVPLRQGVSTDTTFEARVEIDRNGVKFGQNGVETGQNGVEILAKLESIARDSESESEH
jgi:hypothetical protein